MYHRGGQLRESRAPNLMTELSAWSTFYTLVGTAAGSLTGLQFVVVALISDLPLDGDSSETTSAFSTPTIFHFGAVLVVTALLAAPWRTVAGPAISWGAAGLFGLIYTLITARRMRRQSLYAPVLEDWMFHVILPALAYAVFLVTACLAALYLRYVLFGLAGAVLLLLVIGIHNAWDNVMYLVHIKRRSKTVKP